MARVNVCTCNALTVPHVHDKRGIVAATDAEVKAFAQHSQPAAQYSDARAYGNQNSSRFNTPVSRG